MSKKHQIVLLTAYCLLFTIFCLQAAAKDGLDLTAAGAGARPMGMGRAFLAVADDANAAFSNPAGLGLQKQLAFTTMSTRLLGRVEYKMIGGVCPTQFGTVGIGYLSSLTPAGYQTTDKASIASAQAISYGSSVMLLSYGRELNDMIRVGNSLGKLSVGANYKVLANNFEGLEGSGSGSGLDLGLLFEPSPLLSTALKFQNVGGKIEWKNNTREELPIVTSLGAALNLGKGILAADVEMNANNILFHGGAELKLFEVLALRAGVDQARTGQDEKVLNLTGGVGIKVEGFSFDCAYRQDNSLADNAAYFVSVSFQPELAKSKPAAKTVEKSDYPLKSKKTAEEGIYQLKKKALPKGILSYYNPD